MNRIAIIPILFLAAFVPSTEASGEVEVEQLVRNYLEAFKKQNWEEIVKLMHPRSLAELRSNILSDIPKSNEDEIDEDSRADAELLLEAIGVKTPEEAWQLPAETVCLRTLKRGSELQPVKELKEVESTIKSIRIARNDERFVVDVEIESIYQGRTFSGTTQFVVEAVEGKLKVLSMTKTKN